MFIDFRERRRDRQRQVCEKNINLLPPVCDPTRDQTHNLVMCPDWESKLQPFWCVGQCSNQLAHPARAEHLIFNEK